MYQEILKQLNEFLDAKVFAFFSVTLQRREDGSILPTMHEFGENLTYEERLWLSDALIEIAQHIRGRK